MPDWIRLRSRHWTQTKVFDVLGLLFRLLFGLAIALGTGFGASYYALTDGWLLAAVRVGPWVAWPDVGQAAPNPYTRAYLARTGHLQLGHAEGIQFSAFTDDDGETLDAQCTYEIRGTVPGASFWTLVATALDGTNIAASDALPALHSERIARSGAGDLVAAVGPHLSPGNWLETAGKGEFVILLTLYDATAFSGGNSALGDMPSIRKLVCP